MFFSQKILHLAHSNAMITISDSNIRRLTSLAVLAGLFVLRPDAFLNPQFWAEDGRIFFKQSLEGGLGLMVSYAGYLHAIPRLGAWLASLAPLELGPAIFNYLSIFCIVLTSHIITTPRWSAPHKPLLALCLVLVPQGGEVLMNLTNLQWFSAIWLLVLALQDNPSTRLEAAGDFLLLALSGLTGPFIILFLPLLLLRVHFKGTTPYNLTFILIALAAAGLQAWSLVEEPLVEAVSPRSSPKIWPKVIANRFTVCLFLGAESRQWSQALLSAYATGMLLVYLALALVKSRRRKEILFFLAAGLAVFLAAAFKFRSHPLNLVPFYNGDRYFFLPRLMIMWSLIMTLDHASTAVRRGSTVFLAMIVISGATWHYFNDIRFIDFQWKSHIAHFQDGDAEKVRIPINPPGWSLELDRGILRRE